MKMMDDLAVAGRRVLARSELNAPPGGSRVADDSRTWADLNTLTTLLDRDAEVTVCAHLGRPDASQRRRFRWTAYRAMRVRASWSGWMASSRPRPRCAGPSTRRNRPGRWWRR